MSLRVLVADDDAAQCKALASFFESDGALSAYAVRVVAVENGREAWSRFQQELPDVVVVELLLPEIDGLTLCRSIRAHRGGRDVALFAVSRAYRNSAHVRELRDELDVELLGKPIDLPRLAAKVLARLGRLRDAGGELAARWGRVSAMAVAASASPLVGNAEALQRAVAELAVNRTWSFVRGLQGAIEPWLLASLLVSAAAEEASGTLTLSHRKARKVIYLERGQVVYVDSNLRQETLGALLVAQGKLEEPALVEALKQAEAGRCKLGEVLVRRGMIEVQQLEEALAAQVKIKLAGALRWAEGTYAFAAGAKPPEAVPDYSTEIVPLVLAVLPRMTVIEELTQRYAGAELAWIRLTPLGMQRLGEIESAYGMGLARALAAGLQRSQLRRYDGDDAVLLPRIEALRLIGFVEVMLAAESEPAEPAVAPSTEDTGPVAAADEPRVAEAPAAEAVTEPTAPPRQDAYQAELAFRRGERLLGERDVRGAVAALEEAVTKDPSQADYHAHLAWARCLAAGGGVAGASAGDASLREALALAQSSPAVLEIAARLAEAAQDREAVVGYLQAAVKADATRVDLFEQLRQRLADAGDYGRLERAYRGILFRLRDQDQRATAPLWIGLADLYRQHLGQPDNARLALEVASKVAPDDARVLAALQTWGDTKRS